MKDRKPLKDRNKQTQKKQEKQKRAHPMAQVVRQVEWPSFPAAFSSALGAFLMTAVLSAGCTAFGMFISSLF